MTLDGLDRWNLSLRGASNICHTDMFMCLCYMHAMHGLLIRSVARTGGQEDCQSVQRNILLISGPCIACVSYVHGAVMMDWKIASG